MASSQIMIMKKRIIQAARIGSAGILLSVMLTACEDKPTAIGHWYCAQTGSAGNSYSVFRLDQDGTLNWERETAGIVTYMGGMWWNKRGRFTYNVIGTVCEGTDCEDGFSESDDLPLTFYDKGTVMVIGDMTCVGAYVRLDNFLPKSHRSKDASVFKALKHEDGDNDTTKVGKWFERWGRYIKKAP